MKYLTIAFAISFILINTVQAQLNTVWAKKIGGSEAETVYDLVSDSDGNVYVTGGFTSDTAFFDNQYLLKSDSMQGGTFYLAKYDPSGNLIWVRGAIQNGSGIRIVLDDSSNVFLAGTFISQNFTLGNYTLINSNPIGGVTEVFVAKFDSSGNVIWAKSISGGSDENVRGLSIDINENIYIGLNSHSYFLYTEGDTIWNLGLPGYTDIVFLKYNKSGDFLWMKNFGGNYSDWLSGFTIDQDNNIALTGVFMSSYLSFDSIQLINPNPLNNLIFLAKIDSSGNVKWAKSVASGNFDDTQNICNDDYGNIFVIGRFTSPIISFDTINVYNSNISSLIDVFIAKYNSSGNAIWANGFSSTFLSRIIYDNGMLYTIGSNIDPGLSIGSNILQNSGVFVAKFDNNGNSLWAQSSNTSGTSIGRGINVNSIGEILVTGIFSSQNLQFGNLLLQNTPGLNSTFDVFIAKLGLITSKDEILFKYNLIYPNPANDFVSINLETNKIIEIKIFDIVGKLIEQETINYKNEIDVSELNAGIYFVKVITEKQEFVSKLIKQ